MKTIIKATNLTLTDKIKGYVDTKIGELDKYLSEGTFAEARVELQYATLKSQSNGIFRAEVNIKVPGKLLRAEAEGATVYAAIDLVKDEVQRELREYKNRRQDLRRRGLRSLKKRMNLSPLARRQRRRKKILGS